MITISLCFLFSGCTPLAEVTIQVMEPAQITLPPYIKNVSFINRSYLPSLMEPDTGTWTVEELHILDTIINYRTFEGIAEALNQSPLFDLGSISVLQGRRTDTTNFLSPLNHYQLEMVAKKQDPDALVSLEHYKLEGFRELGYTEVDYTAILRFYSETCWRIYDMAEDTIIDEHMLHDTLIWEEFGESHKTAFNKLPIVTDALREAGHHAGFTYGLRISPSWSNELRYYHIGKRKEMKNAAQEALAEEWDESAEIWRKLAYRKNKRMASLASFNMALVCEMKDLIDAALEWAAKSYLIKKHKFTKEYIELLEMRKADQDKLNVQLPSRE